MSVDRRYRNFLSFSITNAEPDAHKCFNTLMSSDSLQSEINVDDDITLLRRDAEVDLDDENVASIFLKYRHQLERMIEFRIDQRIRSRIDSHDILQESFLEIKNRYREFIVNPGVSFFVWIRKITYQVLIDSQRRHFRQKRGVQNEVQLANVGNDMSDASQLMARELIGQLTSPSEAAIKAEELERMHAALESMNETDREILALRHFEQLSNADVAQIIGIKPAAASNRYIRAITKLGEIMERFER